MVIPDEDSSDEDSTEENDPITASPSDAENSVSEGNAGDSSVKDSGKVVTIITTSEEEIPVTWDSEPTYDGDTEGTYVFTADVGGYALSDGAKLPQITVTVGSEPAEKPTESQPGEPIYCTQTEGCTLPDGHEGECVITPPENGTLAKTITSWTFVATDYSDYSGNELAMIGVSMDDQADFDAVVAMLPTQINADIESEEEPVTLGIPGWACPEFVQDEKLNYPISGEFIFTAKLPEGYACKPLPTVKVLLGGAKLYAAETGDFTVTGGNLGVDYSYNDNTLTINTSTALTITGTTTTDKILVPSYVNANLTLSGVSIDVSGTDDACAFAVAANGIANITLSDTNTLSSGKYRAGLEVPESAQVTISGSGELNANGGSDTGAGIGGGYGAGGTIEISGGTVIANGSSSLIGFGGSGGKIVISGGMVTATSSFGAGIGGGRGASDDSDHGGDGGDITINGNAVVFAKSENSNASHIGGVSGNNSGTQTKTGGVVFEGNTGTVYGSPELPGDVKIPGGSTLTVLSGSTLTIPDGITLDNQGTIDNKGTINIYGIITGNQPSGGTINNASTIVVTFAVKENGSYGNATTTAKWGDTIRITAAAQQRATNARARGAVLNKVDFYIGSVASGNKLGTVDISSDSDSTTKTATATLEIELTGNKGFVIGSNIITADFGGSSTLNLLDSVGTATLTVRPQTQGELKLHGLASAYTYGDKAINLSTTGGSGSGAGSYKSSNSAVASVSGNTVTIHKAGTFTITATKAGDSHYAEAKVTSKNVTVHSATPNMSLTASGGKTTTDPLILTATVSKVGTGVVPAGTVTFKEDNTPLHSGSLDGDGKATYTVSNPEAGSHTYTAEYSGQADYYNKTNATRTIDVGLADQTGFAITDPGTKTYGDGDFDLIAAGGQGTGSVSYSVTSGNSVLTVAADGKVKIIGAGKVTVTATKDGDSTYNQATATREITVNPRDISNVTVKVMGSHVYTGSQLQPGFDVYDGGNAITTGDYTNSYGTNVAVGTGAGSITLTGQRNYTGTKTVQFDIDKRPLDGAVISLESSSYTHTGSEIKPAVTNVTVDGITVLAAEYDVGYADNKEVGTATVTITAKADGNFSGLASTTFTITKANTPSGGGGSYSEPEPQSSYTVAGDKISQTISRSDIKKLADSGKSLTLRCDKASMTFNPAVLKAILPPVPATAGNITFAATPADLSAFPDAAKLIGAHPVYSFTIGYKDSKGNPVVVPVNFPAGSASISLNYTPAAEEVTGSLFMVYVDGKGAVTWLDKSSYDNGKVLAEVPHFSTYGVAYKEPAQAFTDAANHWAKADIEFVTARGLLSGTGNNLFSPDGAMTRGMFVTALGRLAGINPDSYQTRSFTDVKADAYYAAYVEWATQKNIVKGTSKGLFSPDAPVTREQMAVMMVNYAGRMGYSVPAPLAAVTFADNGTISTWAAKEVAAMQRAGIIKGKDGNRFDPQASATRAEVSAVLRRFVEIVIDPATVNGWVKNDSGHWLYYKGGTALTGWRTIGKLRYYFNADGVMHEGWKQDTDTNKWYYWTSAGAATGWREIGGKWYYFDENGVMAVNTKIDGYEIGPDGARKCSNKQSNS